jgi:ABC-type Fe3+-hydroxamate transport system substrate-binding protein
MILPAGCLLVLFLLMSGCIQSPPAASVTPQQTGTVSVLDIPDTTVTEPSRRVVTVAAEKMIDRVDIQVLGGKDAGALTSLSVRIKNYDGTSVQRNIPSPEIGRTYSIQYYRNANAASINIVGIFSDGYQQTLLMNSL